MAETEARALGLRLQRVEAHTVDTFEAAFDAIVKGGAQGLLMIATASWRSR